MQLIMADVGNGREGLSGWAPEIGMGGKNHSQDKQGVDSPRWQDQ